MIYSECPFYIRHFWRMDRKSFYFWSCKSTQITNCFYILGSNKLSQASCPEKRWEKSKITVYISQLWTLNPVEISSCELKLKCTYVITHLAHNGAGLYMKESPKRTWRTWHGGPVMMLPLETPASYVGDSLRTGWSISKLPPY